MNNSVVARYALISVPILLLLVSCSTGIDRVQRPVPAHTFAPSEIDDIRESVLRYHIKRVPSKLYFISLNESDPTPSFLKRFHKEPFVVKPHSIMGRSGFYVKDKKSGERGVLIWADEVYRKAHNIAEVHTGWNTSGRSGNAGVCRTVLYKSKWTVRKYNIRVQY